MDKSKHFLHDRLVLLLITLLAALTVIGVSWVLIRFDASNNQITTAEYREVFVGTYIKPGKSFDIYALAIFMLFTAAAGTALAHTTYKLRRQIAIFLLAASNFLLTLAIIVANSLISLQ